MRKQFEHLGIAYDWHREIATCDPGYYRWEQWFFIQLYEKGLVYKKNAVVNWDPVDQTVLANEQVVDGHGWRSGALVERREIPQWFFKITAYADELLNDLDKLTGWPPQVCTMQRNWIGRSEGVNIHFPLADSRRISPFLPPAPIRSWASATSPSHPEHPLALQARQSTDRTDWPQFIEECRHTKVAEADMATQAKKGMCLNTASSFIR